MPHVERARQGASWGLLGTAQLLTHSRGEPTKLSHAGPGWVGRLAQASLTQTHSGRGPRSGRARQYPWSRRVSGFRQRDKGTHLPFISISVRR